MAKKESAEATVRNIRRNTRKKYGAEEKIRIVLEGLKGESTIAELCRHEGIAQSLYYKWSKEFLEAGKQRLSGNTKRQADSEEVSGMKHENEQLKLLVADNYISPWDVVRPGENVQVQIIKIEPERQRIGLSLKDVNRRSEIM